MAKFTSLRANIIANYASQLYASLIGLLTLPLYLKHMGSEAYGLVSIYSMLQAWFQLLDMGLSPTLARQVARYRGGATSALDLRVLVRTLEIIFALVALAGALGVVQGREYISMHWLKVQTLTNTEVQNALTLMALVMALRWISGLYRAAISGFEQLVWLGMWNSTIATLRFVLVFFVFIFIGTSATDFFGYQLGVAIFELLGLAAKSYRSLPVIPQFNWSLKPFRKILKFSLGMAFTSSVWVLITQTDKLVLSKLLTLSDYGYFTTAVLAANSILILGGPVSAAIVPRMSRLHAQMQDSGMLQLYRSATQLAMVIALPLTCVLASFPEQVLWAWTGDRLVSERAASVLTLYSLGNGILSAAAFQHYLQYAKGDLKLHVIGNILFVITFIPVIVIATLMYGIQGAGWAWFIMNTVALLFWVPLVHRRVAPGLHLSWLLYDVGVPFLLPAVAVVVFGAGIVWPSERLSVCFKLVEITGLLTLISALGSSYIRTQMAVLFRKYV